MIFASNIDRLAQHLQGHKHLTLSTKQLTLLGAVRFLRQQPELDGVLVTTDAWGQANMATAAKLVGRSLPVIAVDTVLPPVDSALRAVKAVLLRRGFELVRTFVLHHKATEGYETQYGIPRERIQYVPFKLNAWERLSEALAHHRDGDEYLLVGRSQRDVPTFLNAARLLTNTRFAWLRPTSADLEAHGTDSEVTFELPNVRVITDDGTRQSFERAIAQSRAVVVTIRPQTISAAGLSTYLDAMSLGKCVVMSDCPAVRGNVPEGVVRTVKAGVPEALAIAIQDLEANPVERESIAKKGSRFAHSLAGEARYLNDLADVLLRSTSRH
jgi:glycosyltransferase involved in cell wall biosynthesis